MSRVSNATLVALSVFFITLDGSYSAETRCGYDGPVVKFPFSLKHHISNDHSAASTNNSVPPSFELSCTDQYDTLLQLPHSPKLLVEEIDYTAQLLLVSDPDGYAVGNILLHLDVRSLYHPFYPYEDNTHIMSDAYMRNYTLFNCSSNNTDVGNDFEPIKSLGVPGYQVYPIPSTCDLTFMALWSCTAGKTINLPCHSRYYSPCHPGYYSRPLLMLSWSSPKCRHCEATGQGCRFKKANNSNDDDTECFSLPSHLSKGRLVKRLIAGLTVGILGFLIGLMIAKRRYRTSLLNKFEKANQAKIEKFLEDYKSLKPIRYSYAEVRRITNHFQIKLGEGGYGSVFKGMLSNDIPVAVKLLNDAKGNGDEFINEVGTIGTIHHVNVVRLFGFCADGFRRALVYEFLPNESLEKFIFLQDSKRPFLGWPKLQDIAKGIAKGIEYLHQGCDQRILHFDIKPHNILLDYNFNPKISDFGLAKLCSKDKSAVSMTAARGTMGYIAPEVVSRNFGNASHKSDVYSFGMMLLEMVGGRKNMNATADKSSQVYFPEWIYKRIIHEDDDQEIKMEFDGDEKIAKKLSIVGLWCIQWYPIDRPSMNSVVQMLEGETDSLTIPPSPFASTTAPEKNTRNIHNMPCNHHVLTIISEHDELE